MFYSGLIAFLLFEFAPDLIISMFGHGSDIYIKYARLCFRIYLSGIILTCIVKSSTIFLQSCGSSLKSMLLSISRDVLFFVPAILILGLNFGIVGMLWSSLIADILSFILAIVLIKLELNKMDKTHINEKITNESNKDKIDLSNKVITISREYGSGGRYVAKVLSEKTGLKLYDKELIDLLGKNGEFSKEFIETNEEIKTDFGGLEYNTSDKLFIAESKLIKKLAKEPCIIVGRCSDYILKDKAFKIFLYSDEKSKINRCIKYYNINSKDAKNKLDKINKERSKYYEHYTGLKWMNPSNYDLMINVDRLGVEETANKISKILGK